MADLIDRQAAIDAIEEYFDGLPIVVHYDMLEMVKALPSVQPELPIKEKCCYCPHCANCDVNDDLTINQPEQRWIPCSEAVPMIEIDVLLTAWDGKREFVGWIDAFGKWFTDEEDVKKGYEPLAWMPLPEPYGERRTDE